MAVNAIPVGFLKQCLDYEPSTGAFRWRSRPESHFTDPRVHTQWNRHKAGTPAFVTKSARGYLRACLTYEGREIEILAQRAAWVLMTGEYPADQVDHKNTNTADNRWCNLREATQSQNNRNRSASPSATSGLKGAVPCSVQPGKWRSSIWVDGKSVHLGRFASAEAAHAAYAAAARKHYGEFARAA
jgi:citrate synthase